jgi:hypothetical protein
MSHQFRKLTHLIELNRFGGALTVFTPMSKLSLEQYISYKRDTPSQKNVVLALNITKKQVISLFYT